MDLMAISVSHKTAPVNIRELFAFTQKKQIKIINDIVNTDMAKECLLLSTCNRTEFYLVTANSLSENTCYKNLMSYLSDNIDKRFLDKNLSQYIKIYQSEMAIEHIFSVTAGLDSMVIGEDQILGQVKNAHQLAIEYHTSNSFLNTLFRLAITAAKKVKTETNLSKTPVSIATLATKATIDYIKDSKTKNIMIIGATGRLGSIILKDIKGCNDVNIFVTSRNNITEYHNHIIESQEEYEGVTFINYNERYKMLNEMDAIISATASPHFTIEADKTIRSLTHEKKRIFIDLAVPKDIEVTDISMIKYLDIDDFEAMASHNNSIKEIEVQKAKEILNEYIYQFNNWQIYNESNFIIKNVSNQLMDKFDNNEQATSVLNYILYKVKAEVEPSELQTFINCLETAFCE